MNPRIVTLDYRPVIYLAGPMLGCSDDEMHGWRNRVQTELADEYRFLDPTTRDYRGREDANAHQIVTEDVADIDAAEFVLAMAERPTWGTGMEIRAAFRRGKKVIAVCSATSVSPWLRYHVHVLVPTLDAAIAYLKKHDDVRHELR